MHGLPSVRFYTYSSDLNVDFAVEQTGIQIMALPFTSCATLGESVHLVGLSIISGEMALTTLQS